MPMINAAGITPITISAYIEELSKRFRTALGDDLNLQSETPQGQLIGIFAALASSIDDGISYVADGLDINKATNNQLDVIGKQFGIPRLAATFTTANVTVRGRTDATIGNNITLVSDGGFDFRLTPDSPTIDAEGTSGTIQSVVVGSIPLAERDQLTSPTNFNIGQITVNEVTIGRDIETDAEYRSRIRFSIAYNSIGSIDGIIGNLQTLSSVRRARVFQNDANAVANLGQEIPDFPVGLSGTVEGDIITISALQTAITGAGGEISFTLNGETITANSGVLDNTSTPREIASELTTRIGAIDNLVNADDIQVTARVPSDSNAIIYRGKTLANTQAIFDINGITSDNITLSGTNASDIFGANPTIYNSISAHTIVPVVDSNIQDIENIGNMIILSKPAGINTIGNITFNGETSSGLGATIKYTEVQEINVTVSFNIVRRPGYRVQHIEDIRRTIGNYINTLNIGEPISETEIQLAIATPRTVEFHDLTISGKSYGAIFGSAVTTPSTSAITEIKINDDDDLIETDIPSGSSAQKIIDDIDRLIEAKFAEEQPSITYRGQGNKTYFEIRNLPSSITALSGASSSLVFGESPTLVHGFENLVVSGSESEVHFNQKLVINDTENDIKINSA